jgi:hypothetical protein
MGVVRGALGPERLLFDDPPRRDVQLGRAQDLPRGLGGRLRGMGRLARGLLGSLGRGGGRPRGLLR